MSISVCAYFVNCSNTLKIYETSGSFNLLRGVGTQIIATSILARTEKSVVAVIFFDETNSFKLLSDTSPM